VDPRNLEDATLKESIPRDVSMGLWGKVRVITWLDYFDSALMAKQRAHIKGGLAILGGKHIPLKKKLK